MVESEMCRKSDHGKCPVQHTKSHILAVNQNLRPGQKYSKVSKFSFFFSVIHGVKHENDF